MSTAACLCAVLVAAARSAGDPDALPPGLWLRINDPAIVTANGQRLVEISELVHNASSQVVVQADARHDGGVDVRFADGYAASYPAALLDEYTLAPPLQREVLWTAGFAPLVPTFVVEQEGMDKVAISHALATYGIALLTGLPASSGTVLDVAKRVGHPRVTNYGDVFDVRTNPNPQNLADTGLRIKSHTDNPYRDPYVGVQMLHCLQRAGEGGETTFVDGFAAAESLRRSDPAAFALLSSVAHPFEYRADGVKLQASAPVITLDAHGRVVRVTLNNRSAGRLNLPHAELLAYYKAWAAFDALANSDEFLIRVKLQPGHLALWHNGRVMHGRSAFAGAERHLQGVYIDLDEVYSTVATNPECSRSVFERRADELLEAVASQEAYSYGEGVTMLEHALQVAHEASLAGETQDAVVSALLHDIGNSPQARALWREATGAEAALMQGSDGSIGYANHSAIGGHYATALGLRRDIGTAIALHVPAKRALVAHDPAYFEQLSQASVETLAQQGGPMSDTELSEFMSDPAAKVAMRLRTYDDLGKVVGAAVPPLEAYRSAIVEALLRAATLGDVGRSVELFR